MQFLRYISYRLFCVPSNILKDIKIFCLRKKPWPMGLQARVTLIFLATVQCTNTPGTLRVSVISQWQIICSLINIFIYVVCYVYFQVILNLFVPHAASLTRVLSHTVTANCNWISNLIYFFPGNTHCGTTPQLYIGNQPSFIFCKERKVFPLFSLAFFIFLS